MSRNRLAVLLVAALWLTPNASVAQQTVEATPVAECSTDHLLVRLDDQSALSFQVEVADTVPSRARGLMFRQSLPAGEGMLFVYDEPQPVSFWMRNTLIPLDIVFVDAAGIIRHIHSNARPLDETPIPGAAAGDSEPDRLMVLEIAGGEAARLGLHTGQAIAHPAFGSKDVAWPCV